MDEPKLTDERAKFEAWIDARPGRLRNSVGSEGDSPLGKLMWEAWQARAAISTPAAVAKLPESYVRNCVLHSREGDGWLFHDTGAVIIARLNGYTIMPTEEHARLVAAIPTPPSAAQEVREVVVPRLTDEAMDKIYGTDPDDEDYASPHVGIQRATLEAASKACGVSLRLGDAG